MRQFLFLLILTFSLTPNFVAAKELVITFGGDVNFNRSGQAPKAKGVDRFGRFYTWDRLTRHINHLFDGDLNFINLETVITDRKKLKKANKKYVFRSHPNSLKHMRDLGVNLVSTANNHAYDYGYQGYQETLKHVAALRNSKPETAKIHLQHTGIGKQDRLFRPTVFAYEDTVIAFNAVTFMEVYYPAKNDKDGVINANDMIHWQRVIDGFAKSKADIKILSLHKGAERQVEVPVVIKKRLRKAVKDGDINLVLAHHPHVARGVERVDYDSLIYYGLGNFLMLGARNMGPLANAQDFGLFGRVIFKRDIKKRWHISATQVIPLTDMHLAPKAMGQSAAGIRLNHLNRLSRKTSGKSAVTFDIRPDATGVACFDTYYGGYARSLCGTGHPKPPMPKPAKGSRRRPI